jgi:hypothetical protein
VQVDDVVVITICVARKILTVVAVRSKARKASLHLHVQVHLASGDLESFAKRAIIEVKAGIVRPPSVEVTTDVLGISDGIDSMYSLPKKRHGNWKQRNKASCSQLYRAGSDSESVLFSA